MDFRIKLADIILNITCQYELLREYCRDYILTELEEKNEWQEYICIKPDDLKVEYRRIMEKEKSVVYTLQYIETLVALRKIANIIPDYDRFLMHGAVLSWKENAYMFTASSGTGKSTHVALWKRYLGKGVQIINGDKPIISVSLEECMVYGTPWAGKEHWQKNRKVPLKGICIIKRGKENIIRQITPSEALPVLIGQIYFTEDTEKAGKVMELLEQLFEQVPIYQLECDISEEAVKNSFEMMTGEKYYKC